MNNFFLKTLLFLNVFFFNILDVQAEEVKPLKRICLIKSPNGKEQQILVLTPSANRKIDGIRENMPLIEKIYVQEKSGKINQVLFNELHRKNEVSKAVYMTQDYSSFNCPGTDKEGETIINEDLNFDGFYDIAIIHVHEFACCRNPQYDTWIYNPKTFQYSYSTDYSNLVLNQLRLYKKEKILLSGSVGGACYYDWEAYKPKGAKLQALYKEGRSDCKGDDEGSLYTVSKPDAKGNFIENKNVIIKERRKSDQQTPLEDLLNLKEESYMNFGGM